MTELTWGPILAGYLFLGGLAGGAYIIGALADLFRKDEYEVVSKSGTYVSLFSIIVGLVLLVLDLKRFEISPLVILNAYRHFPGSILTVGTWIITGFTLVSLVTVILWFLQGLRLIRKIVEVPGVVLGISTAAYTGILLSFSRGMPFWSSPFLPWLFVVSGILTGLTMAMFMVPFLAVFMPRAFSEFKALYEKSSEFVRILGQIERHCIVLTILEIALVVLYLVTTPTSGTLFTDARTSLWFYTYIILGLLAPLGIGFYNIKLEKAGKNESVIKFAIAGQILVLLGGIMLRYIILIGGQMIF